MLPPEKRLVGAQLDRYIRDELYWVLHVPRQTGKTTFLQSWMREINAGSEAVSCYVSVERCQGVSAAEKALPAVGESIQIRAKEYGLPVPESGNASPLSCLYAMLENWAGLVAPKMI